MKGDDLQELQKIVKKLSKQRQKKKTSSTQQNAAVYIKEYKVKSQEDIHTNISLQ